MPTRLGDDVHTASPACPSPEQLQRYLNGWTDEEQAEQLEQHLAECSDCRQATSDFKPPADTLLQSLQSSVAHRPFVEPGVSDSGAQPIAAAIERVKQLVDKPAEAAVIRQAWQPAQREIGVYDLQKPLGRGGMGAVYLATHRQLRKQVAIKLLPILSAEDSDVRARFDREIRVVGKLNHPSIVAATDAGEVDGTQFLVMEYVPGMDLSRLARVMGRLPIADACELMRQTALGLSCAHAEGVVHRDIKPSNLMLDDTGRIRILDFGLAQLSVWDEVSIDLTTVGQLMGTLDYMAPEQAEGSGGVDYRADLYALGATLFRLLSGRPPLAAAPNQSPLEKLRLLANHQPPKLNTLCPEAPEELVSLMSSLLARNPQDRPASAAHVAEQLAPFAVGATLVEMLQQAKDKAAAFPELLRKSPFDDHPGFSSPAPGSPFPLRTSAGAGRGSKLRWWLLAAALPLLIVTGILIKLELDKGQLIIESEVADVRVTLMKDGRVVDGIQVAQGTTITKLKADRYEITIDGPSDGLTIDKNVFTLKNGETVVARIRHNYVAELSSPDESGSDTNALVDSSQAHDAQRIRTLTQQVLDLENSLKRLPPTQGAVDHQSFILKQELELRRKELSQLKARQRSSLPAGNRPLYEGQPLEYWLEVMRREHSSSGLSPVFDACAALMSDANRMQIADAMFELVSRIDGTRLVQIDSGERSSIHWLAASVLFKALHGSEYYERWIRAFESADKDARERLWEYCLPFAYDYFLSRGQKMTRKFIELDPFLDWAERKLQSPLPGSPEGVPDPVPLRVATCLRNLLNGVVSSRETDDPEQMRMSDLGESGLLLDADLQRAWELIVHCDRLEDDWWLNQPLLHQSALTRHSGGGLSPSHLNTMHYSPDRSQLSRWQTAVQSEVVRRAMRVFQDDAAPMNLVLQASMILLGMPELKEESLSAVAAGLKTQLASACRNQIEFTRIVRTSPAFSGFLPRTWYRDSPLADFEIEVPISDFSNFGTEEVLDRFVILHLLELAVAFDLIDRVREERQLVLTQCYDTLQVVKSVRLGHQQWLPNSSEQREAISGAGTKSRPMLWLSWPTLAGSGRFPPGRVNVEEESQEAITRIWGDHKPTREDWLKYLVLLHPAMKDLVTMEMEGASREEGTPAP